jgi:Protein of unknown function (DUF1501)
MPLMLWHEPCHSENRRMEVRNQHEHSSAFGMMNSLEREGLVVASRRNALKASLAGLCGLSKGLRPLLPLFDHLFTTLVADLDEQGLLDDVLVIAMGEFGRTPVMGTQGSTDGRDHWAVVMSMARAGGGFRHGQVIGATEADGGHIKERPVTPGDFAATIYHHMGVPLDATYVGGTGRPRFIVELGRPIGELN